MPLPRKVVGLERRRRICQRSKVPANPFSSSLPSPCPPSPGPHRHVGSGGKPALVPTVEGTPAQAVTIEQEKDGEDRRIQQNDDSSPKTVGDGTGRIEDQTNEQDDRETKGKSDGDGIPLDAGALLLLLSFFFSFLFLCDFILFFLSPRKIY